jgi:sRNA-binding carbon storage regulator CsrA
LREEIYNAIQEENRAAAGRPDSSGRLEDVGKRLRKKALERDDD